MLTVAFIHKHFDFLMCKMQTVHLMMQNSMHSYERSHEFINSARNV